MPVRLAGRLDPQDLIFFAAYVDVAAVLLTPPRPHTYMKVLLLMAVQEFFTAPAHCES